MKRKLFSGFLVMLLLISIPLSTANVQLINASPSVMNPIDFIFEEYAIPTSNCRPEYVTQDSSGSIWFSEVAVSKIGRFFPTTGSFSKHTTSVSITITGVYSRSLQIDSNGYVWFPALYPNKIVRYSPVDDLFTEYSVPSMNSGPEGIAIDRHDNIWFTEIFSNKIGKISSGGIFTEYVVPTPLAGPSGICVSPDGSIWFTEEGLSLPLSDVQKIAKLNPDTGTIVEYQTPSASPSGQANLANIVSDSAGNIWFVEASNNKIGKFSPSNQQFTEYAVPTPYGYPWDIDDDENGNIWFTERIGNKIGQLLQSGIFNEYSVPTAVALPTGIVCTRDGIWFAEQKSDKICRLKVAPMPSLSDRAAELAKQVIGAPYHQEKYEPSTKGCIWEKGKGYHFFTPQQIKDGYPTKEPGLDCSGLIFWAYNRADFGDDYTRDREAFYVYYEGAEMQYKGNCKPITKEELQPGDLLFFDTPDSGDPDHVAMYVGTFTYEGKTYNTVEATAYGDNIITVASFDSGTGKLTTLKPSTGATRPLTVKYYGRVADPTVAMKIAGKSPVDLIVTDPEGINLTKDACEAGGMCYLEYYGDGEPADIISMPERRVGDYSIAVIPHLNASLTDVYTLEVSGPNGTIVLAKNVSISQIPAQPYRVSSTETSVLLFTDLNKDGTVNILDISIVGTAYGSKTGDPKWNVLADLDKNGIVNILDISMVAKDYGKTV